MANDDAWKALTQANDWIKVADTKAGVVMAVNGVLGGVMVKALPTRNSWTHQPWQVILTFLTLACIIGSAFTALRVFAPRLRTGEPRSLIYFDHIAKRYPKVADFKPVFIAMLSHEEQLQSALAEQLWANSRVAKRKFKHVAIALWLLAAALILALTTGLLEGI